MKEYYFFLNQQNLFNYAWGVVHLTKMLSKTNILNIINYYLLQKKSKNLLIYAWGCRVHIEPIRKVTFKKKAKIIEKPARTPFINID